MIGAPELPRFRFDSPGEWKQAPQNVRTVWISDVHLGTRASAAPLLLEFLREYECETLYIVGDLIDIWAMRRSRYWPQQHSDVVQKILRKARKGTRVIFIPGNHDEMISSFQGVYGNVIIQKRAIHRSATGDRILVFHGHELDTIVQNVKWLAFAGDVAYEFLLSLNPFIGFIRRRFGLGYWSLSAYAKQRVKNALSFIGKFEEAVVKYAERYRVDSVLCGHIHSAAMRRIGRLTYYNCGDWVESCSALVEHCNGQMEIVYQRAPVVMLPLVPAGELA